MAMDLDPLNDKGAFSYNDLFFKNVLPFSIYWQQIIPTFAFKVWQPQSSFGDLDATAM
jgi:hypothetical protein